MIGSQWHHTASAQADALGAPSVQSNNINAAETSEREAYLAMVTLGAQDMNVRAGRTSMERARSKIATEAKDGTLVVQ